MLTSPVLRALKEQLGAEVHFLTKARYASLLSANPRVDRLFTFGESLQEVLPALRAERYDFVLDLHKNLRSFYTRLHLRRPAASFPKLNFRKWLLVRFKWNTLPDVHIVQRYMQAGRRLGLRYDGKGLEHFIPEEERVDVKELITRPSAGSGHRPSAGSGRCPSTGSGHRPSAGSGHRPSAGSGQRPSAGSGHCLSANEARFGATAPLIAVAIGGTYATKRLPPEALARLCAQLPGHVLLLGGPQDRKTAEYCKARFNAPYVPNALAFPAPYVPNALASPPPLIINLCGQLSLQQSASVLAQADLVLAHDTGMMHIAAALKKPLISIWGNTVPAFGMYPLFPEGMAPVHCAEVKGLSCRPCSKLGFDACPKGHFRCMKEQDLDEILARTREFLSKNRHL